MQVDCPKCSQVLGGNNLNVATADARYPGCEEVFPLSSLVQASASGPFDPHDPPRARTL
jgi:hypothetical protein